MFEPENELERSLLRAAAEPTHGPAFLRAMFNGTTFVALEFDGAAPAPDAQGKLVFPEGTKLSLRTLRIGDQEYLPFFTTASRARATFKGKFVVGSNVTREFLERHPGKQFVLNPGHEHAWVFPSDEINRLLAGQFGAVATPTAVVTVAPPARNPAMPRPAAKAVQPKPAEAKPAEAKPPEAKQAEPKPVESKQVEPKPPESKPETPRPSAPQPAAVQPPIASSPVSPAPAAPLPPAPAVPVRPPVITPMVLNRPITKPVFAEEEAFIFNPLVTAPPKSVAAEPAPTKPAAPKPAEPEKSAWTPSFDDSESDAASARTAKSEAAVAQPAPTPAAKEKPGAIKPAEPQKPAWTPSFDDNEPDAVAAKAVKTETVTGPPAPAPADRPNAIKAAASETLAAWRRLTAKKPAADKPELAEPPAIKPMAKDEPPAQDTPAAKEAPAAPKPAAPKPATPEPVTTRPAAPNPIVPNPIVPKPVVPKPVVPKPIVPPPPVPQPLAAAKPAAALPPPPGATIGKPDPYPVEILLALTSVFQCAPAIEAACLGQAQFPGRPAHLVVALSSPEGWDGLMEKLGPALRKALPPGHAVEFTPLPGGMFEEYFRTEAQPFFKKR